MGITGKTQNAKYQVNAIIKRKISNRFDFLRFVGV